MKLTKKQIDAIKPGWEREVPLCSNKLLGDPPLASKDGCEYFHEESQVRQPTEQFCTCPGCEQQKRSIGVCVAAVKHKMVRK